jgi:hypothetical protein
VDLARRLCARGPARVARCPQPRHDVRRTHRTRRRSRGSRLGRRDVVVSDLRGTGLPLASTALAAQDYQRGVTPGCADLVGLAGTFGRVSSMARERLPMTFGVFDDHRFRFRVQPVLLSSFEQQGSVQQNPEPWLVARPHLSDERSSLDGDWLGHRARVLTLGSNGRSRSAVLHRLLTREPALGITS